MVQKVAKFKNGKNSEVKELRCSRKLIKWIKNWSAAAHTFFGQSFYLCQIEYSFVLFCAQLKTDTFRFIKRCVFYTDGRV